MAKEQDLPLNPLKISGVCGRLMCCLSYESELYHSLREKLPRKGQEVSTSMGAATVVGGNPLRESVLVELESGTTVELPLSEVAFEAGRARRRQKKG
jgi:cell fate regulator YaaT (PSP1 superfamily)